MGTVASARTKKRPASTSRKKSTPKKRTSAKPAHKTTSTLGDALEGRYADVAGIAVIGIAIVVAAGLYGDVAGPIGRVFADAARGLAGLAGVLVPPVLVLAGVALIRDNDPETGEGTFGRAHLMVGGTLAAIAGTGLLHVFRDNPSLADGFEAWARAGGLLGLASGRPLVALAATAGAAVVLITLAFIAFFVITQIPVRTAAGAAADAAAGTVRPLYEAVVSTFSGLFHLD